MEERLSKKEFAMSPILFEIKVSSSGHKIAFVTLNSEKSLNSLTFEMIEALSPQLATWAQDPQVACVVLQGAGEKAFCAGGDIRALYEAMIEVPPGRSVPKANRFFELEYELDHTLHTYPKPVLCMGHGIVMGGGLGLLAGSSHRVLSERSLLAMPEITIGLYPDVGASWFLNRMPQRTGLFLGLTGARMNAHDSIFVGLGDYFVTRDQHTSLLDNLLKLSWSQDAHHNHQTLSEECRKWHHKCRHALPESELRKHYDFIQEITDAESIQQIWERFSELQVEDPWILNAKRSLLSGSPTSAAVIFDQLKHTRHFSLKECFEFEYRLSCRFAMHPDFREGIRARIIDKDNTPKWTPSRIQELKIQEIRKMIEYHP
jgi:enoyl-CoA hydratase/carnithine racemase